MTIEWFPQAAAILLAGTCALTDLLRGKVYNKTLLAGIAVAAIWLAALCAWHAFGGGTALDAYPELGTWWWDDATADPVLTAYLGRVAGNALLAFVAGFGLWWFGMWAAGDAKLFATLALMLPLSSYAGAFWPAFPSYVLLFNTFLAVLALLVLELAIRGIRQAVRPTAEESEAWGNALLWVKGHAGELAIGFVGILFLFLVVKTLRMLLRDVITDTTPIVSPTAVYFALFLVFTPLSRLMRRKWVGIPVAVATLGWITYAAIFPTPDYNLGTILHVGALSIGVVLFLVVYELYLNVFDFHAIGIWQLRPRMILARKTREVLKEDMDLVTTKLGDVGPDGLSADQAETLRRWWIDKGKGARIHVSRTIPFAPALFLGTLMTVLLGGYLVRTN